MLPLIGIDLPGTKHLIGNDKLAVIGREGQKHPMVLIFSIATDC